MFNKNTDKPKYEQPKPRREHGWIVLTDADPTSMGVSPLRSVRKSSIDSVRQRKGYTTVSFASGFIHCKEDAEWILRELREEHHSL